MAGIGTLFPLLFLVVLAAIIAIVVFVVVRLRSGEPLVLSFRALLTAYFYLMTIVSLLILAVGLSILLKAGLGSALGREFSYYSSPMQRMVKPAFPPGRIEKIGEELRVPTEEELRAQQEEQRAQQARRIENQFRTDLVQGITMVVVGGLVWVSHLLGRGQIENRQDSAYPFYNRAYLTLLLAIFSVAGVIALVSGINDTLRFYIIPVVDEFEYHSPPGGNLAAALVFVPVWLYYLLAFVRQMRAEG